MLKYQIRRDPSTNRYHFADGITGEESFQSYGFNAFLSDLTGYVRRHKNEKMRVDVVTLGEATLWPEPSLNREQEDLVRRVLKLANEENSIARRQRPKDVLGSFRMEG